MEKIKHMKCKSAPNAKYVFSIMETVSISPFYWYIQIIWKGTNIGEREIIILN